MEIAYSLLKNKGFKWHSADGVSVRGYFYCRGNYAKPDEIIRKILKLDTEKKLVEFAGSLSGCFSIVADTGFGFFAFSNKTRSVPMLYGKK